MDAPSNLPFIHRVLMIGPLLASLGGCGVNDLAVEEKNAAVGACGATVSSIGASDRTGTSGNENPSGYIAGSTCSPTSSGPDNCNLVRQRINESTYNCAAHPNVGALDALALSGASSGAKASCESSIDSCPVGCNSPTLVSGGTCAGSSWVTARNVVFGRAPYPDTFTLDALYCVSSAAAHYEGSGQVRCPALPSPSPSPH
jgi:hypothetical protein